MKTESGINQRKRIDQKRIQKKRETIQKKKMKNTSRKGKLEKIILPR
jgi:hypothetical protein